MITGVSVMFPRPLGAVAPACDWLLLIFAKQAAGVASELTRLLDGCQNLADNRRQFFCNRISTRLAVADFAKETATAVRKFCYSNVVRI